MRGRFMTRPRLPVDYSKECEPNRRLRTSIGRARSTDGGREQRRSNGSHVSS